MDILKILDGIKGKVLDAAHFELLKHAYELQENNISQLKTNNAAIKESNELLKEHSKKIEGKAEQLEEELYHLKKQLKQQIETENDVVQLSENATKIIRKIISEDITDFYQNAIIDVMGISKIAVEAALDELVENGVLKPTQHGEDMDSIII